MPLWIAGAVAAVLFGAGVTGPQQRPQTPVEKRSTDAKPAAGQTANDDLIKLAVARMSEDILLGVVAKTDKTKYDMSADALLKLKSAGVSDRVIAAQAPMIATTFWVSTMMQVGAYKKEFTGAQTQDQQGSPLTYGAWGKCANQIASNISSWTKTNAVLMNHYKAAASDK